MPLYEYECNACGERTEAIQKFSDDPLTVCASCGGKLGKLFSAPAIQFKGEGWYVTDYARKGKGKGSSEDKPDKTEKESGKKEGSKSEHSGKAAASSKKADAS